MLTKVCLHKNGMLVGIETTFTSILRHNLNKKILKYSTKTMANLSYKIYGESTTDTDEPPILLFHALLGMKKHWDTYGKTINSVTKRAVVSVDLRNHGDSPHVNSHKYEELAEDILKLYEKLDIRRASLVGHGMGGMAAMCVSLIAPEKAAGILIVDISPLFTSTKHSKYYTKVMGAMKQVHLEKQKHIFEAKQYAKKQLEDVINDDFMLKIVLSNIKMRTNHSIGWACNLDVLMKHFKYVSSFPSSMKKKQYYGQTLFVGGQLSEYLPADDLPSIRAIFPRAVIIYIPHTGHNPHVDDPKTFLELAISFLRTNK